MYQQSKIDANNDINIYGKQDTIYTEPNIEGKRIKFKKGTTEFLNKTEENKFYQILENEISESSTVSVNGYSSSDGNKDANFALSLRRAQKITKLITNKYPNVKINISACGENQGDLGENRAVLINVNKIRPISNVGNGYLWSSGSANGYTGKLVNNYLGPDGQHVMVYLSGLYSNGITNQFDVEYDSDIEVLTRQFAQDNGLPMATESYNSVGIDARTKSDVINFINKNLGRGGKLIIVGYSWGGDTALEISDEGNFFGNLSKEIDLLITIDASDGWLATNQSAGNKAKRIINYYQPIKQLWPPTASGQRRLSDSPNVTNILIERTSTGDIVNHSNIDEEVLPNVINDITSEFE